MRNEFLPDVLQGIVPWKGWRDWRNHRRGEMRSIRGVVWHDTVTPYPPRGSWTLERALDLLYEGRPDLNGPLSQVGVAPDGTWYLTGNGRCNHNGYGSWGNDAIGLEVICGGGLKGAEQPWNGAQFESVIKGTAAILRELRLGPAFAQGHREQDRRKGDPFQIDLPHGRTRVAQFMNILNTGVVAPTPSEEEADMLRAYTVSIPADGEYHPVPFPPPGRPDVGTVYVTFAGVRDTECRVSLYNTDGTIRGIVDHVKVGRGRTILPLTAGLKDERLGSVGVLNRGTRPVTALVELVK